MPQHDAVAASDSVGLEFERRAFPRHEVRRIGSIWVYGQEIEKCLIEDVSQSGARIVRFLRGMLPGELRLQLSSEVVVPVSIVWEKDAAIGLSFCYRLPRPLA